MLNARLFAGLAALTFAIAILGRVRLLPRANLWLTVGWLSFGAFYLQLFIFLVCAFFGFVYFGIARLKQRPVSPVPGLIGFLLVAFASAIWLISSFLMTDRSRPAGRLAILLFAAMGCFILGAVFSTANVAWALLRK
jgi:hypothetical protein